MSKKSKRFEAIGEADTKLKEALDCFLSTQRVCSTAPSVVQNELQICHDRIFEAIQHFANVKAYVEEE